MALIKEITLENGIIINYHRVVSVNNITNHSSIIEVASYTSKAKREEEKRPCGSLRLIAQYDMIMPMRTDRQPANCERMCHSS